MAGNYTVTITDNAGCTTSATATVGQPVAVNVEPAVTEVSCNGGNNGSITLSVSGGTGLYTYNWGGGITTPGRNNITAGNYTVTITDANSCTVSITSTVETTCSDCDDIERRKRKLLWTSQWRNYKHSYRCTGL